MIARILRHDWKTLRADATVWLVAGIAAAAVGLGAWNGTRWVQAQQATLTAVASEERERYAALARDIEDLTRTGRRLSPFADPRLPATFGARRGTRSAVLPPGPLAAFSIGQSDLLPSAVPVSTEARELGGAPAALENPYRLLVGRFDLAFVVIYLFPLLIIGLTYNLLSGEREDGTLALVLSQPVTVGTLVAGKVAVRLALLLALVLGTALVALAAIVSWQGAGPGLGVRVALWGLVVCAYGVLWFALGVLVVSRGAGSASTATVLAGTWLLLVVLIPALAGVAVNALYPVPSRVQMVQAIREASDSASANGSALLARYFEEHPELAGGDPAAAAGDAAAIRLAVNDAVERDVRPVVDAYERQRRRQQALIERLRYLSPAMLMQDALNDLAGTGTTRYRHFSGEVDRFHAAWRAHFTPLILGRTRLQSLEAVPMFQYREEHTLAVATRVMSSVAGLSVPAGILAWLGMRRLRRYPVTAG